LKFQQLYCKKTNFSRNMNEIVVAEPFFLNLADDKLGDEQKKN
jgi:hypothetical protein